MQSKFLVTSTFLALSQFGFAAPDTQAGEQEDRLISELTQAYGGDRLLEMKTIILENLLKTQEIDHSPNVCFWLKADLL